MLIVTGSPLWAVHKQHFDALDHWRAWRSIARQLHNLCVAFPVLVVLLGLLLTGAAVAQSRTTVVDKRKPALIASSRGHYYDTPQAAWEVFEKATNSSGLWHVFGFRPCANTVSENQAGYLWGAPLKWCHTWELLNNGQVTGTGVSSVVSTVAACPIGYETITPTPLLPAPGDGGAYILETRCEKAGSNVSDPRTCSKVGNPINADDGSKLQTETDYTDPNGILTFSRSYDSKRGGFMHNFAVDLLTPQKGASGSCAMGTTRIPDPSTGSYLYKTACFPRLNHTGTQASFLSSQGHRHDFTWDGAIGTPVQPYNKDRFISRGSAGWILSRMGEHRIYAFDSSGRLESIHTLDGRQASLSYSTTAVPAVAPDAGYLTSISDTFGRTLHLEYTDAGQLVRLVDPTDQAVQYEHESLILAQSDPLARAVKPIKVIYQDASSSTYLWDEAAYLSGTGPVNRLTGIVDGNGERFATFRYTDGNAKSTAHAGSVDSYSVADGRNSNGVGTITVTDPLGTSRSLQFALAAGLPRIVGQSQPGGAGCTAASRAMFYDANGNITSKTDFNGIKSCHVHDLGRNLETARIEGLGSTDACPADLSAYAIPADTPQRKTTTQWHPDWSLPIWQAGPEQITTSVYNGRPDPTAGGALASCAPASALLPDGKPITVLCKKVEQATTDATGSLGFAATLDGVARVSTWTYNQYGQMLTARDPRSKLTTYAYYVDTTADHTTGDLQSVTDSSDRVTQYTRYDKSGRLLQSIDANGTVTDTSYTPRGWVKTVTSTPPGAAARLTVYDYDGVGQLKKATLPDSMALEYTYDAAHRLTAVKDSAGNSVTYTLDNMGNRQSEDLKDPSGTLARNITRVFDALNRAQSATGATQ